MSDETPPRDATGRFVRQAAERMQAMSVTSDEGIHPMSKALFGWTEARGTGTLIFWLLAGLSLAISLLDLAMLRREPIALANASGFYALFAFAAFSLIVLSGWVLGPLLRRPADYYGEDETLPPADIDAEAPLAPENRPADQAGGR
jgi:hypothetical protein